MRDTLIARALVAPQSLESLSLREWGELVRDARASLLLGRIAWLIRTSKLVSVVPEVAREFLLAHEDLAIAQHEAVRYEAEEILRALSRLGCPVIFLKGGAYVLSGREAHYGRLLGDIDIMVPQEALREAEVLLKLAGWSNAGVTAYDQRYYRQWMHELPAMRHRMRGTMLDVHHTILPPTAKANVPAQELFHHAVALPQGRNAFVLSQADALAHCATHLFHEGEFEKGLRDLSDFSILLDEFLASGYTLAAFVERTLSLDLAWPVYLALRYNREIFAKHAGDDAMEALSDVIKPSALTLKTFDAMFSRALRPHNAAHASADIAFARWLLYIRSHWLRMPPHLLVQHLTRKGLMRVLQKDEPAK